ncbi:hypothetical protein ABIB57_004921 [Devosia sp. UYZn731]|uniref:hypothetical protein n=1 Tax=Devosia sp. UYZn731 TaxID=3156345 RepID=UPI0033942A25
MAAKLQLQSRDMPFLYNVSDRVGPGGCPNRPTDVELLKVLLVIGQRSPQLQVAINGSKMQPNRDTIFDPILGFYIFRMQQLGKMSVVDGVASPAKGANFAPGTPWVVYWFNYYAKLADPALWESLPRNRTLSPSLAAELSR